MKGFVERVSHILVSDVMILIWLLYVSQVGCQHLKYDFRVTLKQKGVLSNEEIAAFVAEIRYIDTASTGGYFSVFDDHALVARRREAVVDQVRESAPQIEHRRTGLHHPCDDIAAMGFFLSGESQLSGVRIGRVEIKGYCPDIFGISGRKANMLHSILVDLVDGHVEADVIGGGMFNILHDGVVGIATDCIMTLPVAVQTEQNQVRFRQINREGTVGHHIDDEKAHLLCFYHQIPQGAFSVPPEEGLTAAEEQDADSHVVELLHFSADLLIGMHNGGDVIDGTMLTLQVAFVCYNDRSQDRLLLAEQNSFDTETCKMQKGRKLHKCTSQNSIETDTGNLITEQLVSKSCILV